MIDDRDTKNCVQCDTVAWSARSRYAFCAISGIKKFRKANQEYKGPVTPRSTIYVIQMDSKEILHQLGEDEQILLEYYTFALMTHPLYENILVSGSASGKIVVWDAVEGVAVLKFIETGIYSYEPFLMNDIFDGRFSPDGSTFVVGTVLGALSIYSTNSAQSYALTHTEQFFLAQGLTPDELEENIASKCRICNHQLAQYDPQPPISMVRGLTHETMTKLTLQDKMNQFQEFLKIQQREFTFLKKIKGLDEDQDDVSEVSLTEVINNLENEIFLNFFEGEQGQENEEDSYPIQREHCETMQDHLLFEFHRRKLEIEAEKDVQERIRDQVAKENKFYEEQGRVIEAELNINDGAFGRVLEEHTFEETMGQRDQDTPTNSRMRRNVATPMRVQVQSAPARQQRQRVSQQRNAQVRDVPITRQRGNPVNEIDEENKGERRSHRRATQRRDGVHMMLPTAWNSTGVQPHRRIRPAVNTIGDSDQEEGEKKEMEYDEDSLSQEESERRLRPNRKTKYDFENEEEYFALEEESEEDDDDDELSSDQEFEAFRLTTTRRSNRISKRKYESSEGTLSELEPRYPHSNQKSQFASSRTSRANQSRSSNIQLQNLSEKLREQQKAQAKVEPYILYFTEKNPNLLSICQFCKRTLGHESSYIGPFKRDGSKCQIENSNFKLQDLPEKAFIHYECLRSNDLTYEYRLKRNDPDNVMWVCIGQFFLCKLSDQDPKQCVRCNEQNYTVTCYDKQCDKVFHGHICAELNGMNFEIDGYLRFKCYECLWRRKTAQIREDEENYLYFKKTDRSGLDRYSPQNLSMAALKMKENSQKDIPKGIRDFIEMKEPQFKEITLFYSEDEDLYAQEQYTSIQAAYKFTKDYIPQIGDEVIFIPQRYEEILSKNWREVEGLKELGENVITNLKEILDITDSPFSKGGVPVKITQINHLFPNIKTIILAEQQKRNYPSVVLKLTAEVIQMPTSSANEEELKEEKNLKELTLYLSAQDLSCFVEAATYEAALREYVKEYESTTDLSYLNGTEQELVAGGRVLITSAYIYEVSICPFSFYKCFAGQLLEQGDEEVKQKQEVLLSPWDLKPKESAPMRDENIPHKLRQEIVKRFYLLLNERKSDFYWFFTFVKSAVAENYQCVIPVESNTNLIMKRLAFDYYRRREAIQADIELIRKNAYQYNQENNFISELAYQCSKALLDIVEDCYERKEEILTNTGREGTLGEAGVKNPVSKVTIDMKPTKPQVEYEEHFEESEVEEAKESVLTISSQQEIEEDDDDEEDLYAISYSTRQHKFKIANNSNPQFLTPSRTSLRRSSRNRSGEPVMTKIEVHDIENSPNIIKIPIKMGEEDLRPRSSRRTGIEVIQNREQQSVSIQIDKFLLQPSVQTRSKARRYA